MTLKFIKTIRTLMLLAPSHTVFNFNGTRLPYHLIPRHWDICSSSSSISSPTSGNLFIHLLINHNHSIFLFSSFHTLFQSRIIITAFSLQDVALVSPSNMMKNSEKVLLLILLSLIFWYNFDIIHVCD